MKPTLVRTAVSGGALALTLGVAAPALACVGSDAPGAMPATFTSADPAKSGHGQSDPAKGKHTLTLAELKTKIDTVLEKRITWLQGARDRVDASSRLSAEQKTDVLARIDAKVAKLQSAREAVAAATTKAEVKAALEAAFTPTVDEVKARIATTLTRWLAWIDAKQAAVEASTSKSADAQAAKLARLQSWEDKLVALEADIAADTTLAEVKADLKAAGLSHLMGHRHGWVGSFDGAKHRWHQDRARGHQTDRGSGKSDKTDPGRWDRGSGDRSSTRQVSFSWGRDGASHHGSDRSGHHRGGHFSHHGFGHHR